MQLCRTHIKILLNARAMASDKATTTMLREMDRLSVDELQSLATTMLISASAIHGLLDYEATKCK